MSLKMRTPMHGRTHLPEGSDPIADNGSIRFVKDPQTGLWLVIDTTGEDPADYDGVNYGQRYVATDGPILIQTLVDALDAHSPQSNIKIDAENLLDLIGHNIHETALSLTQTLNALSTVFNDTSGVYTVGVTGASLETLKIYYPAGKAVAWLRLDQDTGSYYAVSAVIDGFPPSPGSFASQPVFQTDGGFNSTFQGELDVYLADAELGSPGKAFVIYSASRDAVALGTPGEYELFRVDADGTVTLGGGGGGGGGAVTSFAKSGDTPLTGAVTVSEGANITLTQTGNDIQIAAAGGSSLDQQGAGSPVGAVTPTGIGYRYTDTTSGALYEAIGVTSADWIGVGGPADPTVPGVFVSSAIARLMAPSPSGQAFLTDVAAIAGTENGVYWNAGAADGSQTASVILGSAGQFQWFFDTDGSLQGSESGNPFFRVEANGDVHLKTGGNVIADL